MSLAVTVLAALLTIDPLSEVGPVKPVNGVGQPPMVGKLAEPRWGLTPWTENVDK